MTTREQGRSGRSRACLRAALAASASLAWLSAPAGAQDVEQARVGADVQAQVSLFAAEGAPPRLTLMLDHVSQTRLAGGLSIVARPMVFKQTGRDWQGRVAQLVVRHQTTGRVSLRVDGGYLAPPVGLASLEVRPAANPTIVGALPVNEPLPGLERGAPESHLYALTYPLGVQASLSTTRWDARVAVVDSSPLRRRMPFAEGGPEAAPQTVVGGGVTPRQGLRLGGWFSHGTWARASEVWDEPIRDRTATLAGVEGELSFGWTRIAAEYAGGTVGHATGREPTSLFMAEALQTLSPRWYAAGRIRATAASSITGRLMAGDADYGGYGPVGPAVTPSDVVVYQYGRYRRTSGELTVGYRLSPGLTLKAGYHGLRGFGSTAWQNRVATSIVWSRKLL